MADEIIVLDGDDEDVSPPRPSGSASPRQPEAKTAPLASANETQPPPQKAGRLQDENEERFAEFVEHCSTVITEHPEVLNYLRGRHAKASPDFLSSVEFRNTLEGCFARARKNVSKIYVFINELCTVLAQRSTKRKLRALKVESGPGNLTAGDGLPKADGVGGAQNEEEQEASTSSAHVAGVQVQDEEAEKKGRRASQKQIAYLENLLRLYNEEIRRLQLTELSLDDMESEDSLHIQEHKLKRKMMKMYEKLCELKGCDTLTGRVIEQRIRCTATRYPEINKKIERFINSPEVRADPPDYQDIHRLVTRANERYKLGLDRKHLNTLAKEAFRDVGTRIQERRHLDLVFNFGSHLTDAYKPAEDPALSDPSLLRKLKANREESLSRLEEVISKFAVKQEDTEEQERNKRQQKTDQKLKNEKVNGVKEEKAVGEEEEEEEVDDDEEEEDESSDPDIEEEIQASIQQATPDKDEEADCSPADGADQKKCGSEGALAGHGEADCATNGGGASGPGFSPLSASSNTDGTPPPLLPSSPSASASPAEGGADQPQAAPPPPVANGTPVKSEEEPAHPAAPVSSSDAAAGPEAEPSSSPCRVKSSGTSPPSFPHSTLKRKRRQRGATTPQRPANHSEADIPLDMGVFACSSPETPAEELVSSTQLTPPPKKNKVNVSTQCDPVEVIVLSDSE